MKTTLNHRLLAATLLAGLVGVVQANSLHVSDDAYIRLSQQNRNTGTAQELEVGNRANRESQGFVRFDLGSLPPSVLGVDVEFAVLKLWVGRVRQAGELAVHPVLGDWDEASLTATTAPLVGSALASTAVDGADAEHYVTIDVTEQVRDWIDGAPNYGLACCRKV